MNELLEVNRCLLVQAAELCRRIPVEVYGATHEVAPRGSVGGHLRHCVEHCDCLLAALETGELDYASRARCQETETDPGVGAARCEELAGHFGQLSNVAGALRVRSDLPDLWLGSTVERELQFLASHTVHHFALIAVLLRLHGVEVPIDLGVAPSTLRHLSSAG